MKAKRGALRGRGAFELIEEAVHLLRSAPAGVLAAYYLGSVPFVLGFLFFWADMSKSAFAHRYCAEAALGMALLYLWMKSWQAVFVSRLKAHATGAPPSPWTRSRIVRMAVTQTIFQPYALILLPVAAVVTLPFGWLYAFYHNLSWVGDGQETDLKKILRQAWHQATLWPGQNHLLAVLLWMFGLFVFFNLMTATLLVPWLFKSFFGIETTFTLSGWHVVNTTFFAAIGGFTYLCMNPLIKTAYVLRCFYGESLHSGADLKADLQRLSASVQNR